MTWLAPRPIDPGDNLSTFTSGEASLDQYLVERALSNHVAGVARCYVCIDKDDTSGLESLVGYYTLSAIAVEHSHLAGRLRRNAPNPVPAVLLGRLAVDERAQATGLGRFLVRDAILSTMAAADRIGVRILLVHALNSNATKFYETLGFRHSPTDPLHLYLSLADARASY
ncbi:MAG: GNAT family N-acetyltransferase [Propionibacteriaceae bacterium]|jgi:GNAT superfamily N-acetyltransferase|nr:GNAT family N-acetyltransferase [Propionibacteriaceae bacterium]